jgi:hypothetical protein
MFTKDELYREYDQLIGLTMFEIIKASKDEGVIRLLNFNPLNKGHIYLLRIALFVRDIHDMPIELDCDSWDVFRINWKMRKGFSKVKKASRFACKGVRSYALTEQIRNIGKERIGEHFLLEDIYNVYYKGSII